MECGYRWRFRHVKTGGKWLREQISKSLPTTWGKESGERERSDRVSGAGDKASKTTPPGDVIPSKLLQILGTTMSDKAGDGAT